MKAFSWFSFLVVLVGISLRAFYNHLLPSFLLIAGGPFAKKKNTQQAKSCNKQKVATDKMEQINRNYKQSKLPNLRHSALHLFNFNKTKENMNKTLHRPWFHSLSSTVSGIHSHLTTAASGAFLLSFLPLLFFLLLCSGNETP